MKVVITNPPWRTESGRGFRSNSRWPYTKQGNAFSFPIYLAYAAAILEKEGFDVKVIDAVIEDLSVEEFVEKLKKENPKLALVEVSTPSIGIDLKTIKAIKESIDSKIAICSPHATIFHKQLLEENPAIDFVIRGEFEYSFRDIAIAIRDNLDFENVKGISYRGKEVVLNNPDRELIQNLDELPFPSYHLFDVYAYGKHAVRLDKNITMISSRGCPYQCIFCLWPSTMYGHKWRARSPNNVVDEMEFVVNKYGAKEIFFDDDTFTISKERVRAICDEIVKRGLKVRWQCYGHVGNLDFETFKKMKEAGCYIIRYGVESGNDDILKLIKKGSTTEMIEKSFSLTKEAGVKTFGTFMFGFPWDTKEKCERTIEFAKKIDPDFVQFSIVTPYPGTEFYDILKKEGRIKANSWAEFDGNLKPVYELEDLSIEDMKKMLAKAYREFYLRPTKILQTVGKIKSWGTFKRTFYGFVAVLKGRL